MSNSEVALATLAKHGKSFRFAGYFLPEDKLAQAARLYAFCRWIDDIADESSDKAQAKVELNNIQNALESGTHICSNTSDFLLLQQELGFSSTLPIQLIEGVKQDLYTVEFETEYDLIRYAYRVAGVVGLMMCPILGADEEGLPHATNLGIAMQLTNIARDVFEDAVMGRRYIPRQWCDVSAQEIVKNSEATQNKVVEAVKRLLTLSESYYCSGWQGLTYLPKKSRTAIAIAASVYREIGVKLAKHHKYAYWHGRTHVKLSKKVFIASSILLRGGYPVFERETVPPLATLQSAISDLQPYSITNSISGD